jgi:hypothetical protein
MKPSLKRRVIYADLLRCSGLKVRENMVKKKWTLLSNHGVVLAFLAEHPKSTTQVIEQKIGLSIHGVQRILDELEDANYISRQKEGRCNHYVVHVEMPLRHRLHRKHLVGEILFALGAITEIETNKDITLIANKAI